MSELSKTETLNIAVRDLVSSLMYYDRKEDDELSREDMEELLNSGIVTLDDIADTFRDELKAGREG